MDGGAWRATVHGVAKSQTRLSDFTYFTFKTWLASDPFCQPLLITTLDQVTYSLSLFLTCIIIIMSSL